MKAKKGEEGLFLLSYHPKAAGTRTQVSLFCATPGHEPAGPKARLPRKLYQQIGPLPFLGHLDPQIESEELRFRPRRNASGSLLR